MLIAITIWNGRIAPLFDSAGCCFLFDADNSESLRERISLPKGSVGQKAAFLKSKGVSLLICGAISKEGESAIISEGISLYPFIAGPVDDVVSALNERSRIEERFAMPGCRCRRRRCRSGGRLEDDSSFKETIN